MRSRKSLTESRGMFCVILWPLLWASFIPTSDFLLALKFLTQRLLWWSSALCIQTFCWFSPLECLTTPQVLALCLLRHLSASLHLQVSVVKVTRVIVRIVNHLLSFLPVPPVSPETVPSRLWCKPPNHGFNVPCASCSRSTKT